MVAPKILYFKSKETSNKIKHLIEQESKFFKRNLNNKFKSLAINEADKLKEFLKKKKRR